MARILTQKFKLGLFEKPYADTSGASRIGSAGHRAVAREAAAESQDVAGSNADDIGSRSAAGRSPGRGPR